MIGFGGWDMPVQYTGIMDEHHAVRKALGVFDISHMGQFFVSGAGAAAWLNQMLTNNVNKLAPGQGQYTLMLNVRGGVIDDLIIYRIADAEWLLVVNAAKLDEDFAWMQPRMPAGVKLSDVVKALNAMGATPQDLLVILQAMKSAGALHAEIEVI